MTNQIIVDDGTNGEDCEGMVCMRATDPLMMADNLVGECSECGSKVQYRPHNPKHLVKICLECALPEMNKAAQEGDLSIVITEKARQDVLKKLGH